MSDPPVLAEEGKDLRRYTQARVALGRIGSSLRTADVLDFAMAHARARDAVHLALHTENLGSAFEAAGFSVLQVRSEAANRSEYLKRPDLGRRLHPDSQKLLRGNGPVPKDRLTIIVADGLSSLAGNQHALPLVLALRALILEWTIDTVMIATQARVALSDQIGQLRNAEAALILLGERPGLSSPDSLGAYLTYEPRTGRTDAERNCVSNIHAAGLSYAEAAHKIDYLLHRSREAGRSGISIKDDSQWMSAPTSLLEGS